MALHEGESPIDLPDDEAPGLRWAVVVALVSSAALVLLNAHAFGNWAEQHPDAAFAAIAYAWQDQARALGLTAPEDRVEQAARAAREADWPGAGTHHR